MAVGYSVRCLWESDFQWKARSQFIETWRYHYPEDRLSALSMVWANMKFLGCRYPVETEELVKELESKCPRISLPCKAVKKPKPLIENFTIYEIEGGDDNSINNPVSVINESAQKSRKAISFEDLGMTDNTGFYSCAVVIDDKIIATGEGPGKKQAKRNAAENALTILRDLQPIIRVSSATQQHETAPCLSKTDLMSKAYEKAPVISDDNIGNRMLRKMGWKGIGGIGRDGQGRAEPVLGIGTDGKLGLGCKTSEKSKVTGTSVQEALKAFIAGPEQQIKFSSELSKEDRVVVHKISQQYGLKHKSYGADNERYLVVSKS